MAHALLAALLITTAVAETTASTNARDFYYMLGGIGPTAGPNTNMSDPPVKTNRCFHHGVTPHTRAVVS